MSRGGFPDTLLEAVSGDALEIDELVSRYRFKRRYKYLWVVVSRLTHQVIAWMVGDRSEKTLQRLWQHRPCHKGSGKTSVIEGLNNKWRNRLAELVRKTVCVQHCACSIVRAEHCACSILMAWNEDYGLFSKSIISSASGKSKTF